MTNEEFITTHPDFQKLPPHAQEEMRETARYFDGLSAEEKKKLFDSLRAFADAFSCFVSPTDPLLPASRLPE